MNARCCHARPAVRFASRRGWLATVAAGTIGLLAAFTPSRANPDERERNRWPGPVERRDAAGRLQSWNTAGPFLFRQPAADYEGNTASGVRPFWLQFHSRAGTFRSGHFLYPVFSYSRDENTYKWSVFELIRRWDRRPGADPAKTMFDQRGEFEIFPFWFSRQSGDPEMSYRALFPIYGTVKNKLTFERLSWTLFPLYVENEKRGAVTTSTPWPFIRVTRGAAHGWGVWPVYNYVERPGVSRYESYLWPLGFNSLRQPHPDDPPGTEPRRDFGFLPFYTKSTGPGFLNEDYLWPFFGYTERTTPVRYSERRYFWPLLVQGRGDERMVSRWGPFYTHSIDKGYDKQWFVWPLLRYAQWNDEGVARTRTQFLYFLYWHERQTLGRRESSPTAELTHVWPLFSNWDNGAGRRQWQFPSAFEVLFPGNDKVRQAWTPLFTLARHEQRAPGDSRTSLFWNAITWEEQEGEQRSEFHLGPLLSVARHADEQRIAVGNGLFGLKRSGAGRGWKVFWLDFAPKSASPQTAPR